MFVLASNHFRKYFSVNAGVWLRMENGFSGKEFQLTVKLRPLTRKIFSAKILPSNHFRRHAKRERERERERKIANPKNPRSSHHRRDRQTRDCRTQKTQDRRTANPQTASRIANPRTREPVTDLVLVLVWNFCNKICLWFWFFTFSLWSMIFLLLWWWCGWWCFGSFPIMWWWVLCRWWWKIRFSECYQTHENIF